ncbi:DUF3293 domain-containing protein [Neolewinella aurantiaca]|uniref:DUF3293 domain-containing protein n=1 Tax=Neolewinella aurantiaca TaxID=2602767 RepID=A0A5C7FST6_9BACT|nr:DUF3293 domain-containing protein [Neolewinella aurantiaca]TXF91147.1 DUF3293 domain-containing protein [Neolewinella aurantiaca]
MPHDSSDREKPYFDEELQTAYLATEYLCKDFVLKIGESHPDFDAFMLSGGHHAYAFLTAWNPRSDALPAAENIARGQQLLLQLEERNLTFMPAVTRDPSGEWGVEEGVFIFNAPPESVLELAAAWQQNAVVLGARGAVPRLVWA